MLIRVVNDEYARTFVMLRAPSSKPLFVQVNIRVIVDEVVVTVTITFLLDWWPKYKTYIARQVVPAKDKNGKWTHRFVLPERRLSLRRLIKHKLRSTYGIRHVADVAVQHSAETIGHNLGLETVPRPTLIGNRFL